jgi:hypothetical protein
MHAEPLMLNPGRNGYCGPGALSILAGVDTDTAAAVLRRITGKRAVYGVWMSDMVRALRALGLTPTCIYRKGTKGVTLERWAPQQQDGRYLVSVTGHYCVVRVHHGAGIFVCDNHTFHELPLARYRQRRKRLKQGWKIISQ